MRNRSLILAIVTLGSFLCGCDPAEEGTVAPPGPGSGLTALDFPADTSSRWEYAVRESGIGIPGSIRDTVRRVALKALLPDGERVLAGIGPAGESMDSGDTCSPVMPYLCRNDPLPNPGRVNDVSALASLVDTFLAAEESGARYQIHVNKDANREQSWIRIRIFKDSVGMVYDDKTYFDTMNMGSTRSLRLERFRGVQIDTAAVSRLVARFGTH